MAATAWLQPAPISSLLPAIVTRHDDTFMARTVFDPQFCGPGSGRRLRPARRTAGAAGGDDARAAEIPLYGPSGRRPHGLGLRRARGSPRLVLRLRVGRIVEIDR